MSTNLNQNQKDSLVRLSDGSLVEQDVLRIVEKITEYDPNLKLKYMPPGMASLNEAPYALFEACRDGIERLVFTIWTLDDSILERIYLADNTHRNVQAEVDKNNAKVKADIKRRYEEKLAADGDIFKSYLKSPKGRWSFRKDDGSKITLDDDCNKKHKKSR